MRILQIHNRYRYRGGEEAVVEAEAEVLRAAGHDVDTLSRHNPQTNTGAVASLLLAPWNPLALRFVDQAVDRGQPDIAHVHNTWFALTPSIFRALKRRGLPVILTLHNYRLTCSNAFLFRNGGPCELCVEGSAWNAVRYGCYRGSRVASVPAAATIQVNRLLGTWVDNVDEFIALTDFQREIMIRSGLPAERVVVKPNFVADPGERTVAPSDSDVVLYAGRLSEEKGVGHLLDVWRQARPGDLRLVVVGEGPETEQLARVLPPGVEMLGHLHTDDLVDLMLRARALVVPSLWYEGLPRTLIEAFAAGLPTIVSDRGGPGRIVTRALGPEWVYPMGDGSGLTERLNALRDDQWCDSSGRQARRAYEKAYRRDTAARDLIRIYESCLPEREEASRPTDSDVQP